MATSAAAEPMGGRAGATAAGSGRSREKGGGAEEGGLVRAPGVVCRASADLRCLALRSDGGTPSETPPGSTETGTGGT